MRKIAIYSIFILFSCNNSQEPKPDVNYFEGSVLWEKKCSLCHSYLTTESINQTSLDQMRQFTSKALWLKIRHVKNDSNHNKPSLNINNVSDSDLKKIVYYIIKTGQPTP